jgi:hypothetical protein
LVIPVESLFPSGIRSVGAFGVCMIMEMERWELWRGNMEMARSGGKEEPR